MLAAIVDARVGARIEALENELATRAAGPSVVHVKVNDRPSVYLTRRPHARFPFVLKRAEMRKPDGGRFNLFLTGDAGTGKSTIAAAVAEALDLPFHSLNCSGGLTEGALVGRMTPNLSTGDVVYTPGPLVESYRNGGVFMLDELDGADENVLLALNTIADATRWHAPNGETIQRHPDHILIAAGNTYGTGASRIYSGRTQLDGAFLNRWLTVSVDYDAELERSLCATPAIAECAQIIRAAIRSRNLRRWFTTRDVMKADALVCQVGVSVHEALLEVTEGWTAEDRSVCGIV
jgi:midasin (ATPase involved in ribosome maturation)